MIAMVLQLIIQLVIALVTLAVRIAFALAYVVGAILGGLLGAALNAWSHRRQNQVPLRSAESVPEAEIEPPPLPRGRRSSTFRPRPLRPRPRR
jgi:hypothetical protein